MAPRRKPGPKPGPKLRNLQQFRSDLDRLASGSTVAERERSIKEALTRARSSGRYRRLPAYSTIEKWIEGRPCSQDALAALARLIEDATGEPCDHRAWTAREHQYVPPWPPPFPDAVRIENEATRRHMDAEWFPPVDSRDAPQQVRVVLGVSGAGKSTLAQSYAERHSREYRRLFWVNCESEPDRQRSIREIVASLTRSDAVRHLSDPQCILEFRRLLLQPEHQPWLLVFDNAVGDLPRAYWPAPELGDIVITTTFRSFLHSTPEPPIEVLGIPRADAGAHLVESTRAAGRPLSLPEIEPLLDYFSYSMGGHDHCPPPAIVDARTAFTAEPELTVSGYLADLSSEAAMNELLLREQPLREHNILASHSLSLTSLERLEGQLISSSLLRIGALLAPEAIPASQLTDALLRIDNRGPVRGRPEDDAHATTALRRIADASAATAVRRDAGTFQMHRLQQHAVRLKMERDGVLEEWADLTLRLLASIFPVRPELIEELSVAAPLLPHVLRVLESHDLRTLECARLCSGAGWYLAKNLSHEEALPLLDRAVSILDEGRVEVGKEPEDHVFAVMARVNRGWIAIERARDESGFGYVRQGIDLARKLAASGSGASDLLLGEAENAEGWSGFKRNRGGVKALRASAKCFERSRRHYELARHQMGFAEADNNLGVVECALAEALQGLPSTAKRQEEIRALLASAEERHSKNHRRRLALYSEGDPKRVESRHNLAHVLSLSGRHDAAARIFESLISEYTSIFHSEHEFVAKCHEALGDIARRRDRRSEAQREYQQSIAIYTQHGSDGAARRVRAKAEASSR